MMMSSSTQINEIELDDVMKEIEDYFFGECGESLFKTFAKENKKQFIDSKLTNSSENNFE